MQTSSVEPGRTITGTFRIPERVYEALRKEAEEKRVSLNCVVNQLLYEHVFEDTPVMNPMFVALPKSLYSEILSRISEEDAREIGQLCARGAAKSLMLAKHGVITTETIAERLRTFAERGGYGEYSEVSEKGKRIITIMHEFGSKESVSIAAFADALFQMIGLHPAISTTEEAVVIEI